MPQEKPLYLSKLIPLFTGGLVILSAFVGLIGYGFRISAGVEDNTKQITENNALMQAQVLELKNNTQAQINTLKATNDSAINAVKAANDAAIVEMKGRVSIIESSQQTLGNQQTRFEVQVNTILEKIEDLKKTIQESKL